MTPSTTNTAARELLDCIDWYWMLAYAEGKEGRTHDTKTGEAMRCRHEIESRIKTLTQQQGGEQEAGEFQLDDHDRNNPVTWRTKIENCAYRLRQSADQYDRSSADDLDELIATLATLRSKQPAASEGDAARNAVLAGYARELGFGELDEALAPLLMQHIMKAIGVQTKTTATDNTSKQAAGEADGLCDRLQRKCSEWGVYWRAPDAHGVIVTIEQATELLADAVGVEVEITTPPRHHADEGLAWPRGVLNRDKTLELLISHNEWRRGKKGPQTDPRLLGLALDATIAALAGSP